MKKLTHLFLVELGDKLYYGSPEGFCRGFSCMLMQSILAKEEERFRERLCFIEGYVGNLEKLYHEIIMVKGGIAFFNNFEALSTHEKKLWDIFVFYQGMMLYSRPNHYKDAFNTPYISQTNTLDIFSLAKPAILDKSDLKILLDKNYAGNKDNLFAFIKDLEIAMQNKPDLPILISSSNHCVLLKKNGQDFEKPWMYVDTNAFEAFPENLDYYRLLSSKELVYDLWNSLNLRSSNHIVFSLSIFMTTLHPIAQDDLLKKFNEKYSINLEQGMMFDGFGAGLFYLSSQHGDYDSVKFLLDQKNSDINNIECLNGTTPLYIACQNSHVEIVKLLLAQENIDINKAAKEGKTPFSIACQNKNIECIRLLLAHPELKVDNHVVYEYRYLLLYIFCQDNAIEKVKFLLQWSINVNEAIFDGITPLIIACKNGNIELATLLLAQYNIDINKASFDGNTPTMSACLSPLAQGKKELFQLLLNNNADLSLKNNQDYTVLDIAFSLGNEMIINELLMKAKSECFLVDNIMSLETQAKAKNWLAGNLQIGSLPGIDRNQFFNHSNVVTLEVREYLEQGFNPSPKQ